MVNNPLLWPETQKASHSHRTKGKSEINQLVQGLAYHHLVVHKTLKLELELS